LLEALQQKETLEKELEESRANRNAALQDAALRLKEERAKLDSAYQSFSHSMRTAAQNASKRLERIESKPGSQFKKTVSPAAPRIERRHAVHDDDDDDDSSLDPAAVRAAAESALEKLVGVEDTAIARVAHLAEELADARRMLRQEQFRRKTLNDKVEQMEA